LLQKYSSSTYGHSQLKTGHPVRSAIHKQLNGRLVLRWVTTWESLLLYVLLFVLSIIHHLTEEGMQSTWLQVVLWLIVRISCWDDVRFDPFPWRNRHHPDAIDPNVDKLSPMMKASRARLMLENHHCGCSSRVDLCSCVA
jgi:hypothetical protein